MAEQIKVQKTPGELYAISALMAAAGVGLILISMRQEQGAPLQPGEEMSNPLTQFPLMGTLEVPIGNAIVCTNPEIMYKGSGRDTFTYLHIKQERNGQEVSVYGSGIAGVHVGPSATLTRYPLVSPDQPQPSGCPPQSLCAYPWPGGLPNELIPVPICGAPPQKGPANLYVEVYERRTAADADGFASPTCNPRVWVKRASFRNKVVFI